jgi:hypothetical protein
MLASLVSKHFGRLAPGLVLEVDFFFSRSLTDECLPVDRQPRDSQPNMVPNRFVSIASSRC